MGWDVVQIGLKHDLPIEDPIATAEQISKRMNRNVKLVYRNEYEYDKTNNIVSVSEGDEFIQLAEFTVDSSKYYLQMIVSDYQANQILKETDIDKLRKATFTDEWAKLLLDDIDDRYELYEIESINYDNVEDLIYMRIFRENIDLDVTIFERWRSWESAFHSQFHKTRDYLRNYRMEFFERAQKFGCKEIIICSDQGPTQMIYEHMDYSVEQLKQYVYSNKHHEESGWYGAERMEFWKKHAKKISFSSVFQDDFKLEGEDFVELVYDDFKDLI